MCVCTFLCDRALNELTDHLMVSMSTRSTRVVGNALRVASVLGVKDSGLGVAYLGIGDRGVTQRKRFFT